MKEDRGSSAETVVPSDQSDEGYYKASLERSSQRPYSVRPIQAGAGFLRSWGRRP